MAQLTICSVQKNPAGFIMFAEAVMPVKTISMEVWKNFALHNINSSIFYGHENIHQHKGYLQACQPDRIHCTGAVSQAKANPQAQSGQLFLPLCQQLQRQLAHSV